MAGKLSDKFLEADLPILVVVNWGKQEIHLLLWQVNDVKHVKGTDELLSGQFAVLVSIEFFEGLQGWHSETFQLHTYLVENWVLPPVLLVDVFESLPDDLELILEIVLGLLDIPEALFGLKVLPHLSLQVRYLLRHLRVALDVVRVPLLQDVVLTLDGLEFGKGDCQTQLSEQEFKLLDSLSLPFL